jgi:hypothetical protein
VPDCAVLGREEVGPQMGQAVTREVIPALGGSGEMGDGNVDMDGRGRWI